MSNAASLQILWSVYVFLYLYIKLIKETIKITKRSDPHEICTTQTSSQIFVGCH